MNYKTKKRQEEQNIAEEDEEEVAEVEEEITRTNYVLGQGLHTVTEH